MTYQSSRGWDLEYPQSQNGSLARSSNNYAQPNQEKKQSGEITIESSRDNCLHQQYILAVSWKPAYAQKRIFENQYLGPHQYGTGWSLHGLWPTNSLGTIKSFSHKPRRYEPKLEKVELDRQLQSDLWKWGGPAQIKHQLDNHGNCFCPDIMRTTDQFYRKALDDYEKILDKLEQVPLTPSNDGLYGEEYLWDLFERYFGVGNVQLVLEEFWGQFILVEVRFLRTLSGRRGQAYLSRTETSRAHQMVYFPEEALQRDIYIQHITTIRDQINQKITTNNGCKLSFNNRTSRHQFQNNTKEEILARMSQSNRQSQHQLQQWPLSRQSSSRHYQQ